MPWASTPQGPPQPQSPSISRRTLWSWPTWSCLSPIVPWITTTTEVITRKASTITVSSQPSRLISLMKLTHREVWCRRISLRRLRNSEGSLMLAEEGRSYIASEWGKGRRESSMRAMSNRWACEWHKWSWALRGLILIWIRCLRNLPSPTSYHLDEIQSLIMAFNRLRISSKRQSKNGYIRTSFVIFECPSMQLLSLTNTRSTRALW